MFKKIKTFINNLNEYNANKESFKSYKKNQLDFIQYDSLKEEFKYFVKYQEDFKKYISVVNKKEGDYFLMYASEIDEVGNVEFNYDFSPEFVMKLRAGGIQGIEDIEVIEIYLHMVFKAQYLNDYINNAMQEDQNNDKKDNTENNTKTDRIIR